MWVRRFSEACVNPCVGTGVHNLGGAERLIKPRAGEKKVTRANAPPIGAQQLEKFGGQRNKTVLVSLALYNPDHHALDVDIADAQVHSLADSYPSGIERAEDHVSGERWCRID